MEPLYLLGVSLIVIFVQIFIIVLLSSGNNSSSGCNGNTGLKWESLSNFFFVAPVVAFVSKWYSGVSHNSTWRLNALAVYALIIGMISMLNHSAMHNSHWSLGIKSSGYQPPITTLFRIIDHTVSRLAFPIVGFLCIYPPDILNFATLNKMGAYKFVSFCIDCFQYSIISSLLINDMRLTATSPHSGEAIIQTVSVVGLVPIPLCLMLCIDPEYRRKLLAQFGSTTYLLVHILATVLSVLTLVFTFINEDDGCGINHSLWHISCSCILSCAIVMMIDIQPLE